MDAVKLLKDDHEKVKGLFRQFEKARGEAKKKQLADEIMMELEVHSKIEEEIFYPAVREKVGEDELVAEAVEEHHVVDVRSEEHTSELQSRQYLVCRLLLEKKKQNLILPPLSYS